MKWLVTAHRGSLMFVDFFPFFFWVCLRPGIIATVTMSCGEVIMDIDNLILFIVSPAPCLPTDMKSIV